MNTEIFFIALFIALLHSKKQKYELYSKYKVMEDQILGDTTQGSTKHMLTFKVNLS